MKTISNLKFGRHAQHNLIWYKYIVPKLLNPKFIHIEEPDWQPIYKWIFWYFTFKINE